MPERFTIDDYFAKARNSEEQPLLNPEALPAILQKQEKAQIAPRPVKKSTPWLAPVFGLGLSAAVIAVFMLLPSIQNETLPLAPKEMSTKEVPVQEQQQFSAHRALPDTITQSSAASSNQLQVYATEASDATFAARDEQLEMDKESQSNSALSLPVTAVPPGTITGPALMSLSTEQLTALGITIQHGKATFTGKTQPHLPEIAGRLRITEDKLLTLIRDKAINLDTYTTPMRVVIRTDGIGTPPQSATDKTPLPVAVTPRIISVYASGKLMATTWQRQDDNLVEQLRTAYTELQDVRADSSLNGLVPVHFRIEDKRNAYFKEADVILWYEASPDFLQVLPEPYRSQLLGEVSSVDGKVYQPGERYLDTWRTSSGAIINSSLYPNPVSGNQTTLRFSLSENRAITVAVHDIFGRRVTEQQASTVSGDQTITISLPALLENGVYLVVLTTDRNEQIVQRLLLQR